MTPSSFCYQFLREAEGLRLSVYKDAVGLATIGYGHLVQKSETFHSITKDEAEHLLVMDAQVAADAVVRLTPGVELLPREVDALVSFVYNVGVRNFTGSTMLQKLRAGERRAAAHEFRRWVYGAGRVIRGQRGRRVAEELWFLGGHPTSVMEVLRTRADWRD